MSLHCQVMLILSKIQNCISNKAFECYRSTNAKQNIIQIQQKIVKNHRSSLTHLTAKYYCTSITLRADKQAFINLCSTSPPAETRLTVCRRSQHFNNAVAWQDKVEIDVKIEFASLFSALGVHLKME